MLISGIEFVWEGMPMRVSKELVERIRNKLFEGKGTFSEYTVVDDVHRVPETLHKGVTYWLVVVVS